MLQQRHLFMNTLICGPRYYVNVMKVPLATFEQNYAFYKNWCYERAEWLREHFGIEKPTEPVTTEPPTTAPVTTEPTTTEPTTTEPTTTEPVTTEPITTQPVTEPVKKLDQNFTAKVKNAKVKASVLKRSNAKVTLKFAIVNSHGALTVTKLSGSNVASISKNGVVTIRKGSYKRPSFKLRLKVIAAGDDRYKRAYRTVRVRIDKI